MVNFTGKKEAVSLRFNIFEPHHWQNLLKCEEMETTGNKHVNSHSYSLNQGLVWEHIVTESF